MRSSKVGDIFKIRTIRGDKYGIYSHKHKNMGALVHIFEGFYSCLPDRSFFENDGVIQFTVFIPLNKAVKDGVIEFLQNDGLPQRFERFPLFKSSGIPDKQGKVHYWWIWDGEVSHPVGNLTPEQRDYPAKELWNDTLLIERINSDWTPKQHPHY